MRPGGGTGRRYGLKIRWPKGRAGSSPAPGTNKKQHVTELRRCPNSLLECTGQERMAHGEALRLLKEHAKARRLKGGLVFEKSDEGRAYP